MTHFIGAVLVPASVEKIMHTSPTKYPTLYGEKAKEWTSGTALNEFLEEALERFNEQRSVNIWNSKSKLIAEARTEIEEYREGTYATYLADPVQYAKDATNDAHLKYLATEFPAKLEWTDEEVYTKEVLRFVDPEDIRASDGAVLTTYNPDSKWDWWTIGGRWEETYRDRQGQTAKDLIEILESSLVNVADPKNVAELARIEAEIEAVQQKFNAERAIYREIKATMPDTPHAILEALTTDRIGNTPLTWQDIDTVKAKRLECAGYLPWWFPFSLVTKETELTEDDTTHMLTGYEWNTPGRMGWFGARSTEMSDVDWIKKLIEILSAHNEDDYLIYIDFHI